MKNLFYVLLLCPLGIWAQEKEYLIFENTMLTPEPDNVLQFEAALASHNKKYHGPGAYGVRVYEIVSGVNSGSYIWAMGPTHWSSLDMRPDDPTHNTDWVGNVIPHTLPKSNTVYWQFRPEQSRFPKDFDLKQILIWQVDITEDGYDKVMAVMEMVHKVQMEKYPDEAYGVYTNELPSTSQGNDLAIIWFFDKWSWMSEDTDFEVKFDEVHGAGSWLKALADWDASTNGIERELWEYRDDLSGLDRRVIAAERQ